MEIRKSIANRTREFRKKMGYSQEKLAGLMGVSPTAVSNWENETDLIASDKLLKLAKLMGVSVDYLSGATDVEPGNEAKEIAALQNIFHFDPTSQSLKLSVPLDNHLKRLGRIYELKREQGDLFTDDLFQMMLKSSQEQYVEDRNKHMGDMDYIEYEVFPKGHLEQEKREMYLKFSRLPPPAAGSIEPREDDIDA